jgi:exo-1,4-beta-D-glucosaminidase
MYNSFEFDVSKLVHLGSENVLALKITPEQAVPGEGIVELGDTWHDWLNWKYIGFHDPQKNLKFSFPPDRNAGVWKRVYLSSTGPVSIRNPDVATDLPLPATAPAYLII